MTTERKMRMTKEDLLKLCVKFDTGRGSVLKLDLGYTTLFSNSITKMLELIKNEKFIQGSTGDIEQ